MFKVKWAPKCNGVILSEYIEEDEMLHNPRPVYVEELIMLGLDKQFIPDYHQFYIALFRQAQVDLDTGHIWDGKKPLAVGY